MRLATTIGEFYKYVKTPAEAVQQYEGIGFRCLDYNFYNTNAPGSSFLEEGWMKEVCDAGEAAAKLGFTFVQAHSPNYNPLDPDADHEAGMKATLRSIEACGYLGIPTLVVHSGMRPGLTYPEGREGFFRENTEYYRKLMPAAEKYGVNILIENSAEENMGGKYFLMTGQEMADFAAQFDHPLLNCCWDIGHANMRGSDQYQDILAMGTKLKAVHIQDNFGTYDEHIAPFIGTVDMDAVVQGLLAVNYQGYFTFESDNILGYRNGWPHARRRSPSIIDRRLESPSLELRRDAARMLYSIGRYILTQYNCFEY